jgi:hypothetical protein
VSTLVESSQADASAGVKSVAEAVGKMGLTLPQSVEQASITTRLSPGPVEAKITHFKFSTQSADVVQLGAGDPYDGLSAYMLMRRPRVTVSFSQRSTLLDPSLGVTHFPMASQGSRVLFLPPPQRTEELSNVLIRFGPSSFREIVGPSVY